MAADRQRLAQALAAEAARRRLFESIPEAAGQGLPQAPETTNYGRDLENLSIGIGRGAVNQMEGLKGLVTSPVESVKGIVSGVGEAIRNPRMIAEALQRTGERAASGPLGLGEVVGENFNMTRVPSAKPVMSEINVYHGSPHKFEAFDASKIGTGEGAQAYGHGIYLAESPKVAEGYKKSVTQSMTTGAQKRLQSAGGDINKAIAETEAKLAKYRQGGAKSYADVAEEDLRGLNQYRQSGEWASGNLYTADLPDPMVERMLDWDKPLSEQPTEVQKFVKIKNPSLASDEPHFVTPSGEIIHWSELLDSVEDLQKPKIRAIPLKIYGGGNWVKYGEHMMGQTTGGEFYKSLSSPSEWSKQAAFLVGKTGLDDVEASAALREAGIPGIRYLDAGSRGQSGTGTRNFVVFPGEETKVKILKRE